ncbi:hypothetical protein ZWY2020_001919 [Hordeum vulgare]|nr:hypothetical protein ZWY2020_001919 [Hordeum vulgare]
MGQCVAPPSFVRRRRAVSSGAVGLQRLTPLFNKREEAILPTPAPAPSLPRALATRRKMLGRVSISKVGDGFSLHKTRAPSRPKATPVARASELLVCRSLGII